MVDKSAILVQQTPGWPEQPKPSALLAAIARRYALTLSVAQLWVSNRGLGPLAPLLGEAAVEHCHQTVSECARHPFSRNSQDRPLTFHDASFAYRRLPCPHDRAGATISASGYKVVIRPRRHRKPGYGCNSVRSAASLPKQARTSACHAAAGAPAPRSQSLEGRF